MPFTEVFVAGGVRRQPKHPDPVPLALLPQNEEDLGIPADSNANSSCGQQLGGESRGGQRGDVRRRKDASATSSTQSTDRVNLDKKHNPLYTKKGEFQAEYYKVVNHMLTEDEFETAWAMLLDKYDL
uniref:Uncharacterized protein n=1 Tax=Aegilops tauschii subsp. strangulata TaxID=200361 RepID=A0A453PN57_AEGTS